MKRYYGGIVFKAKEDRFKPVFPTRGMNLKLIINVAQALFGF